MVPPLTRSTHPFSPSTPSRSSVGSPTDISTPSTTPRRTPHCKTCHRPRQGHPRAGCPYVQPMVHQTNDATEDGIVEELSSLRLLNPNDTCSTELPTQSKNLKRRLSVRFALLPSGSLPSLSSTSSEIVERLLQPGMMNSMSDNGDQTDILQWRRTLTGPRGDSLEPSERHDMLEKEPHASNLPRVRTGLSRCMPGTLITPTQSLVSTELLSSEHVDMHGTEFLDPEPERKSIHLTRTMSADERSLFLDNLTQSSGSAPAMLFSVPTVDLKTVHCDAKRLGFTVRILPHGSSQQHQWVILAKEEVAAEFLEKRLTEEEDKERKAKGTVGHIGAAAGGALVGAVATFTGLAFS